MNKTLVYVAVVVGLIVTSGAGYYAVTHWETLRLEIAAAPKDTAPQNSDSKPTQQPNHGDFGKRFEPKPPPPNGGTSK